MVEITKDMARYIRKKFPNVEIHRTMKLKGGKRGKFYVPETAAVLRLLSEYENSLVDIDKYPVSE